MGLKGSEVYSSFRRYRAAAKHSVKKRLAVFQRSLSGAKFIGVTGSSAKSTTTGLLSHILSAHGKTRTQILTNAAPMAARLLASSYGRFDYSIHEIGTTSSGNIAEAASIVRPDIAIVTLVAMEHVKSFRTLDNIAAEKSALVQSVPATGLVILNADDENVAAMANLTEARVITFGKANADYVYSNIDASEVGALSFTINFAQGSLRITSQLTGAHNCLALTAAAVCALELGLSPSLIAERIRAFEPIWRRLSLHPVPGGPTFLLDCSKAPYHSLPLALDVLRSARAPRKRFVLGKISDYRGNPIPKYRDTCRAALEFADQVLIVGPDSHRSRATQEEFESGRVVTFPNIQDAASFIKATAAVDELILVKSNSNLHLERLFLNFQSNVQCWANECGKKQIDCLSCGCYKLPFHLHPPKR